MAVAVMPPLKLRNTLIFTIVGNAHDVVKAAVSLDLRADAATTSIKE